MKKLHKFLNLPRAEKRLLLHAGLLVATIRVGLWLIPFRFFAKRLHPTPANKSKSPFSAERLAWAVQVASGYVPQATCLTQALAAQSLLYREGYDCHLLLGVAKDAAGDLVSHAWLEREGKVILGNSDLACYQLLPLAKERAIEKNHH